MRNLGILLCSFAIFIATFLPARCEPAELPVGKEEQDALGEQPDKFPPLLSKYLHVEKETPDWIIITWSFPPGLSVGPQRGLISIPSGEPGTPEVLGFSVDPPVPTAQPPKISVRVLGVMRSCRIAAVSVPIYAYASLAPSRVRYVTGTVRIPWNGASMVKIEGEDPIERILQAYLLNPYTRFELTTATGEPPGELPVPVYRGVPSIRLILQKEGPVGVGHFAWSKVAGENPDVADLAIFSEHKPVPFTVWSSDGRLKYGGRLAKSDRLMFWSKRSSSPYSPFSIYWLCENRQGSRGLGKPQPSISASPANAIRTLTTLEKDEIFYPQGRKNEQQADYWVWKEITAETPTAIAVPQLSSLVPEVTMTARLLHARSTVMGATELLVFRLNETELNPTLISAATPPFLKVEALIPSASVTQSTSVLEISLLERVGSNEEIKPFYLDCVRFESIRDCLYRGAPDRFYPDEGTYEIVSEASADGLVWVLDQNDLILSSQHLQPGGRVIVGVPAGSRVVVFDPRKVAYADLLSEMPSVLPDDTTLVPTQPVDLIIVAPYRFHPVLHSLAEHHRRRGVESHLAALEAIESVFGDGRLSPYSIKKYLRWVYGLYPWHRPSYVLLVGDATWDYWGRFRNGIVNVLPAYRGAEDYPDENWFVCFTPGDTLPEMLIGRIPVRTVDELEVMVRKIMDYPVGRYTPWMNHVLFVTDNEFESEMEELFTRWLPSGYETSEIRVADYPFRDNYYLPEDARRALKSKTSPEATQAVIDQLNEGVVLWEYFGHGAPNVMGHERIFFAGGSKFSDAKRLTNKDVLPVLWSFTCETGNFDYAEEKWNISIGEDLLTRPTGGALNLLVATGRGFPHDHLILARGLHDAVFNRGLRGMAQAFAAACLVALADRPRFEPQQQFCILGDPVFELQVPGHWPSDAAVTVSLDESGRLAYEIPAPGGEASGRVWLRDGGHRLVWERRIIRGEWPVAGEVQLGELMGRYWAEEDRYSFGVSAVLASGLVHFGTELIPPKPVPAREIGSGSPNLVILADAISYSPRYLENGRTIFFHVPVLNNGDGPAPESRLRAFTRDQEGRIHVLENLVGPDEAVVPPLLPNASREVTLRWDPIENSGFHTIFFECDPWNRIQEKDEEDNSAHRVIRVHRKADLRIRSEDITYRHDAEQKKFVIDFSVYNIGETGAAQAVIEIAVGFDDGRPEQSIVLDVWSIPAGERRIAYNIKVPDRVTWFRVTVDPDEVIDEETHKNNSATLPLRIAQ